jgi:PKD repeat protein
VTSGSYPLSVQFNDTSINYPTGWYWDFGDGYNSNVQDPVHCYATGVYTVNLTVTNAAGNNSIVKSDYITVSPTGNRFVNPGFETGTMAGWTYGWATAIGTTSHTGNYSAHLQPFGYLNTNFVEQSVNLTGVSNVSFWIYGEGKSCPFDVYIDGSLALLSNDGANTWTEVTVPTLSYTGYHTFEVALDGEGSIGGDIDDFSTSIINQSGQAPVASFTANVTSGTAPLTVQFNDSSSNSPSSWNWSFGDGNTSVLQNPVHMYITPGKYNVSLTATNGAGGNTAILVGYINVNAAPTATPTVRPSVRPTVRPTVTPTATPSPSPSPSPSPVPSSFSMSLGSGWNLVSFPVANSSLNASSLDGTGVSVVSGFNASTEDYDSFIEGISPGADDFALSSSTGYFLFCSANTTLVISGENQSNPSVTINPGWNMIGWSSYNTSSAKAVCSALSGSSAVISEFNASTGDYDSYIEGVSPDVYNFAIAPGTGYFVYSSLATPQTLYYNNVTSDQNVTPDQPAPVASFTANATNGTAPLTVKFTDLSSNSPSSWLWSFGDGNTSIVEGPVHTYTVPGNYTVSLDASNAGGSNTSEITGYITVVQPLPLANFTANVSSGTYGYGNSSGNVTASFTPYAVTSIRIKPGTSPSYPSGYSPAQIDGAYGISNLNSQGEGKTIAIIDAYGSPTAMTDLADFSVTYGLPFANLTIVKQSGLTPTDPGWALETSLDIEWAHAIAPMANILLVEANSSSVDDLLWAVDYANSQNATVVSMSWGGMEFANESSYNSHFSHPGTTYVVSSGDMGSGVEWPAVSPNVVSVGGTTLTVLSNNGVYSWGGETGWSGSGGGVSAYEPLQRYQTMAPDFTYHKRSVPDVAFDADPNTGVSIYDTTSYEGLSGWFVVGGTSLGAPSWAGIFTLLPKSGSYQLYNMADNNTRYSTNYHDITSGTNGYPAGTGYDLVTGMGSPIVNKLISGVGGK